MFLIGYGLARFTVEFAREPDDFLGLLAIGLSMGQWLSLPMIVVGIGDAGVVVPARANRRHRQPRERGLMIVPMKNASACRGVSLAQASHAAVRTFNAPSAPSPTH